MTDPCDGECMCSERRRLSWESPVEDLVAAIERHNPECVCWEKGGVCQHPDNCHCKALEPKEGEVW